MLLIYLQSLLLFFSYSQILVAEQDTWEVNVCLLSHSCFLRPDKRRSWQAFLKSKQTMAKMDVKAMWSTVAWDDQFGHKHASCVTTDLEMQCENVTWEGRQAVERTRTAEGRKTGALSFPTWLKAWTLMCSPALSLVLDTICSYLTVFHLWQSIMLHQLKKNKLHPYPSATVRLARLWIPLSKCIPWPVMICASCQEGKGALCPWKKYWI